LANLPVGLAAAYGFWTQLHEKIEHKDRKLDHLSAAAFALAIAAVMADLTAVSTAGNQHVLALTLIAVALIALFVWLERRSPEPMISLKVWGRRPIAAANAASLLAGMTMIGITTFLPVYVQGVMGRSALAGGFALSVMVLGWPMGATLAAKLYMRIGLRPVLLAGGVLIPVGAGMFVLLSRDMPLFVAGLGSWTIGFGMGLLSTASLAMIQEIVDWSERGGVTSSFLFARSLGSTFGATAFGAVLNYGLIRSGVGASSEQLRDLLAGADPAAAASLRDVLETSLHSTFVAMFAVALLTTAAIMLTPKVSLARQAPASA